MNSQIRAFERRKLVYRRLHILVRCCQKGQEIRCRAAVRQQQVGQALRVADSLDQRQRVLQQQISYRIRL